MHALIVAVNHEIQPVGSTRAQIKVTEPDFERCQKEKFKQMLRELIRTRRVAFVGEEAETVKP